MNYECVAIRCSLVRGIIGQKQQHKRNCNHFGITFEKKKHFFSCEKLHLPKLLVLAALFFPEALNKKRLIRNEENFSRNSPLLSTSCVHINRHVKVYVNFCNRLKGVGIFLKVKELFIGEKINKQTD